MKGLKKYAFFVALALALCSSCAPCRKCPYHFPDAGKMVHDSVSVRYVDSLVVRDSLVLVAIPQEQSSDVRNSSPGDTSHLETSLAASDAWLDNSGRLHHVISNKSWEKLPVIIPVIERARSAESGAVLEKKIIQEVARQLTWWQRFWIAAGKLFAGILSAVLVYRIIRRKIPF